MQQDYNSICINKKGKQQEQQHSTAPGFASKFCQQILDTGIPKEIMSPLYIITLFTRMSGMISYKLHIDMYYFHSVCNYSEDY